MKMSDDEHSTLISHRVNDPDSKLADVEDQLDAKTAPTFVKTRNTLVCVAVLLVILVAVGIIVAVAVNQPSGQLLVTLEESLNGTLSAKRQNIRWIYQAGEDDGVSTYSVNGDIYIREPPYTAADIKLASKDDLKDPATGEVLSFYDYWISPDQTKILYATNYVKVWRHSFTAKYWIYTVASKNVAPVAEGPLQLAVWSPNSATIAFVSNNNVFILDVASKTVTNVTTDGSLNVVNGVPSWVYEEEVYGGNSAVWWAPDGTSLTYLRSDETNVPIYTIPIYGRNAYPTQVQVKYPKSGYPNPTVQLFVFSVTSQVSTPVNFGVDYDPYIVDVAWFNSTGILARLVPRVQTQSTLFFVDTSNANNVIQLSTQTRENGWIDYAQLLPIPGSEGSNGGQYLDLVDRDGFNHLALFSFQGGRESWLTGNDGATSYEVVSIAGFSSATQTAFVLTVSSEDPSEQHLYSVSVNGGSVVKLTPPGAGFYTTSFSSFGNYYVLNYEGPDVPYQMLFSVPGASYSVNITLENNDALRTSLLDYAIPTYEYFTLEANGYTFNAVMIKPIRFDPKAKGKHPVLLRVYGGPASQLVQKKYVIDWHTYLVSSLGYIVVMMDARGTSGRGNVFKNLVYKQLGKLEAQDQLAMGSYLKTLSYIDPAKVFVWGWSYGGYLTSKIIEADSSNVFTGSIAVAPVTDWRYYDTIYTERYMLEPSANLANYDLSAVHNLTNFHNTRYLLVHGTADDNVHYQHSAILIGDLVEKGVNFEMFAYTDNDHSINTGPNTKYDLYSRLTNFLQDE